MLLLPEVRVSRVFENTKIELLNERVKRLEEQLETLQRERDEWMMTAQEWSDAYKRVRDNQEFGAERPPGNGTEALERQREGIEQPSSAPNPASAPVDGHPCKGQGAEYLVQQDNSNPAHKPKAMPGVGSNAGIVGLPDDAYPASAPVVNTAATTNAGVAGFPGHTEALNQDRDPASSPKEDA